jgi:predicted O-methyltransferase YrrM
MRYLERLDARHRREGVKEFERLRQIPPITGRLLAILAAGAPEGALLEIGTSGGYSALWLSLAGRAITTFEIAEPKVELARETFKAAGIEDLVELVVGDARDHLAACRDVAFCFLDAEKRFYWDCYQLIIPRMVPGGLLVADNVISHRDSLKPMLRKALRDKRTDSMMVPVGSGLLLARKV